LLDIKRPAAHTVFGSRWRRSPAFKALAAPSELINPEKRTLRQIQAIFDTKRTPGYANLHTKKLLPSRLAASAWMPITGKPIKPVITPG
jgi:hypothetical protein